MDFSQHPVGGNLSAGRCSDDSRAGFGVPTPKTPVINTLTPSRAGAAASDRLQEKLSDPQVVDSLVTVLEHADKLALLLTGLEGFLRNSEGYLQNVVGSFAEMQALAQATGVTPANFAAAAAKAQELLPLGQEMLGHVVTLRKAGMLDPEVISLVGKMGAAAVATVQDDKSHSSQPRGIFNLLGLLKDPEIARTLNFAIAFAQRFGRQLGPR